MSKSKLFQSKFVLGQEVLIKRLNAHAVVDSVKFIRAYAEPIYEVSAVAMFPDKLATGLQIIKHSLPERELEAK